MSNVEPAPKKRRPIAFGDHVKLVKGGGEVEGVIQTIRPWGPNKSQITVLIDAPARAVGTSTDLTTGSGGAA